MHTIETEDILYQETDNQVAKKKNPKIGAQYLIELIF